MDNSVWVSYGSNTTEDKGTTVPIIRVGDKVRQRPTSVVLKENKRLCENNRLRELNGVVGKVSCIKGDIILVDYYPLTNSKPGFELLHSDFGVLPNKSGRNFRKNELETAIELNLGDDDWE